MQMERYECKMTSGLILVKDEKILLMERCNTGFEDGMFELPSGHVEKEESLKTALIREMKEEIGVSINPEDLSFSVIHYHNYGKNYINFFFSCNKYDGQVQNCEPEKCSKIEWFSLNKLPQNIGKIAKRVIYDYRNGIVLDERD